MSLYQVAVLSVGADDLADTLRHTLMTSINDLRIQPDLVRFYDEASIGGRDRKSPTVAAYFGVSTPPRPPATAGLADLLKDAVTIVPVVPDLSHFNDFVPDELQGVNGMEVRADDPELSRVASVLLENLNLLRKSRRLFISYRRSDASEIAIQLYELLDAQGFDVFLDTHSIRPGEPFQDILWHRLADTDVIVLLDSPDFLASRWTVEELARANSTNIQILQLIWPGNTLSATAAFSTPLELHATDFETRSTVGVGARLNNDCLVKVSVGVESLRARALAARHAYLVEEFCAEASSAGLAPKVQPERFVSFETPDGRRVITVPTVGVPDAVRYQEIEDEINLHPNKPNDVVLLYDERGVRDRWIEHLSWLDRQLRVKSLKVTDAQSWLRGL
jgi:hypothetical protein